MSPRALALALATAVTTAAAAAPDVAHADDKPLLLETHVGARPKDATHYVRTLLGAMSAAAVRHGDALASAIAARLSRSAGPIKIGASVRAQVQRGRRQFIIGNYAKAVEVLEAARRELLAHTGTVASNQSYRESFHEALLYLGHAYLKAGQPQRARRRIAEAIRSFSERNPSPSNHSPDLLRFYRKIRAQLDQQKRGTLAVKTTPPGLAIFVNEQYRFVSPSSVADLHAGTYRVYAQRGGRRGRVHAARVEAGSDASVHIDFSFDSALTTSPYVGLRYGAQAQQKKLAVKHAAKLGLALGAKTVLLVGFEKHQGRRSLRGMVVATRGARLVRSGMIVIAPAAASPAAFKALARFLLAGQSAPGQVIVLANTARSGAAPDAGGDADNASSTRFFSARVFKWITLGLGAGAAAGAITLLALDGKGTCDSPSGVACPESYETLAPGLVLAGVAVGLVATSVVLFVIDGKKKSRARRKVAIAPWLAPGSVGLSGRFSF